jgi:hypothetical protein
MRTSWLLSPKVTGNIALNKSLGQLQVRLQLNEHDGTTKLKGISETIAGMSEEIETS